MRLFRNRCRESVVDVHDGRLYHSGVVRVQTGWNIPSDTIANERIVRGTPMATCSNSDSWMVAAYDTQNGRGYGVAKCGCVDWSNSSYEKLRRDYFRAYKLDWKTISVKIFITFFDVSGRMLPESNDTLWLLVHRDCHMCQDIYFAIADGRINILNPTMLVLVEVPDDEVDGMYKCTECTNIQQWTLYPNFSWFVQTPVLIRTEYSVVRDVILGERVIDGSCK